jgi:hypothetical protein
MATAIAAARLSCELALGARDRNPRDAWARERYEWALLALERLEAIEIDWQTHSRRVAVGDPTAA